MEHQNNIVTEAWDLWEIADNGFQEVEAGVNQVQRDTLKEKRKEDKKALYIFHQLVDEYTFQIICDAKT